MDLGATAMGQDGAALSERIAVTGAVTEASSFPAKNGILSCEGPNSPLDDANF